MHTVGLFHIVTTVLTGVK